MRLAVLGFALTVMILPYARGQESYSISLAQAQQIALEKAFAVQYAALDMQKSERDVKELLATGLPQVNIVADYSQYIDIPVQVASGDVFGFPDYLTDFFWRSLSSHRCGHRRPPFGSGCNFGISIWSESHGQLRAAGITIDFQWILLIWVESIAVAGFEPGTRSTAHGR
jgi:hypothetical protein